MNHFDQRLTLDGCGGRQNGTMNVYRCLACILCNDCTIVALKSGRLAVVRMTFTVPVSATGDRRKTEVIFCVKITQNEVIFRPCLCRMEKLSAKCISCISYTRAGKDSGKLPGMTELAEIQMRVWHAFAGSPADKLAKR